VKYLKWNWLISTHLLEDNLYVGTSAAEILHFVSIPADPADDAPAPTFIFASRLQPAYTQDANAKLSGVQHILPLPRAKKICILCNDTLTFYSLPELSPALSNTRVPHCSWVGGGDLETNHAGDGVSDEVMICQPG
jgi:vacuolar protein sorting-associated protein 3